MSQVFRSWQQIASYVGKGTRTVQRWEREIDFPVHRPCAGDGRQVIAFADEIDQWMRRAEPLHAKTEGTVEDALEARQAEMLKLRDQVERVREQTTILQQRLNEIRANRQSQRAENSKVAIMRAGRS